jgi:hypothetical protein
MWQTGKNHHVKKVAGHQRVTTLTSDFATDLLGDQKRNGRRLDEDGFDRRAVQRE